MSDQTVLEEGTFQPPNFDLSERLALITGASQGIGRGLSLGLAQAGASLALVTRSTSRLDELTAALPPSTDAEVYEFDLRDISGAKDLVAEIVSRQGQPHVLVNSAGVPMTKDALDVSEDDWDTVVQVGLKALYFMCTATGAAMAERRYGKIINLSSTYATSTGRGKSVYALAKAGVAHLTRSLAVEWAERGVRVNAIAPCLTETPSRNYVFDDAERLTRTVGRIPLGRAARPSDLVGCAIFLASEASDFVTGQTIYVDGGWMASG